MSTRVRYEEAVAPPPSFEDARNMRQKVRAAGLDPNYWYPVAIDKELKRGEVKQVKFWKRAIAVFRGSDDKVRAIFEIARLHHFFTIVDSVDEAVSA